jgi:hypothetical protein
MLLLGLLLVAAATVAAVGILSDNRFDLDVEVFGEVWSTTAAFLFAAGLLAGLAAAVGVLMIWDGSRRRASRRSEAHEAAVERDRLAAEREEELRTGRLYGVPEEEHVVIRREGDRDEVVDLRDTHAAPRT